jgi:hypothetical protein
MAVWMLVYWWLLVSFKRLSSLAKENAVLPFALAICLLITKCGIHVTRSMTDNRAMTQKRVMAKRYKRTIGRKVGTECEDGLFYRITQRKHRVAWQECNRKQPPKPERAEQGKRPSWESRCQWFLNGEMNRVKIR